MRTVVLLTCLVLAAVTREATHCGSPTPERLVAVRASGGGGPPSGGGGGGGGPPSGAGGGGGGPPSGAGGGPPSGAGAPSGAGGGPPSGAGAPSGAGGGPPSGAGGGPPSGASGGGGGVPSGGVPSGGGGGPQTSGSPSPGNNGAIVGQGGFEPSPGCTVIGPQPTMGSAPPVMCITPTGSTSATPSSPASSSDTSSSTTSTYRTTVAIACSIVAGAVVCGVAIVVGALCIVRRQRQNRIGPVHLVEEPVVMKYVDDVRLPAPATSHEMNVLTPEQTFIYTPMEVPMQPMGQPMALNLPTQRTMASHSGGVHSVGSNTTSSSNNTWYQPATAKEVAMVDGGAGGSSGIPSASNWQMPSTSRREPGTPVPFADLAAAQERQMQEGNILGLSRASSTPLGAAQHGPPPGTPLPDGGFSVGAAGAGGGYESTQLPWDELARRRNYESIGLAAQQPPAA